MFINDLLIYFTYLTKNFKCNFTTLSQFSKFVNDLNGRKETEKEI